MRRLAILAGLGIALLGAGAAALVVWATRGAPTTPSRAAASPAAGMPRAVPPAGEPSASPSPPEAQAPGPGPMRSADGRRLRGSLPAAVSALQSRLARCSAVAPGDAASTPRRPEPGVLVVDAATLEGKLRIEDVPREANASASDGFLSCAREVARGQVIPARGAAAGKRVRIGLPVGPGAGRRPPVQLVRAADLESGADPDLAPPPDPAILSRAQGGHPPEPPETDAGEPGRHLR